MALPTLDATFASSVDLPRKQMLAKWLVEELGETQAPSSVLVSGLDDYYCTDPNGTYTYFDISNGKPRYQKPNRDDPVVTTDDIYWNGSQWEINVCGGDLLYFSTEDVAYPWLVASWEVVNGSGSLAVTEVSTQSPLSNYYSLPERYLWAKIAVAAGGPKTEADYISLPKNYAWSDIYNAVSGDIANSAVVVSGAGTSSSNGTYVKTGFSDGKPIYNFGLNTIAWSSADSYWYIFDDEVVGDVVYFSFDDTSYPWEATGWNIEIGGASPAPTLTPKTPNHTDWSEKQALGHIAAAYRGDTGTPENLATYIDWPWRYQVAAIIDGVGPAFPSDGLLAFWKLADLTDASGNGNALINTNGVTFVAGKIGNAADFNSSYLSTGGDFTFGNYWSVSLWFRAESEAFLDTVFDVSSTGGGPVIDLDNGDIRFNDAIQVIGTAPYTLEQWTHVVITRSDSDASLIVNGGTPASFEWFEGPVSFPIWLGDSQGASGRFFDGQIDAVGVWNRTLTNQEILQLYNNGNGVEP